MYYLWKKDFIEAKDATERAIQFVPTKKSTYFYNLFLHYSLKGDSDTAVENLQKVWKMVLVIMKI